jgi:ATP-dependent DNA helicase RecG
MYSLETPLSLVKGIGPKLAETLALRQMWRIKDLLVFVPLRYEDRSAHVTIRQLLDGGAADLVTLQARVHSTGNYYKGRRSIQSATISDETGKLKLMWFNNRFIIDKLKRGQEYLFSGKLNDRQMMIQAVVEDVKDDTIHTGRLIPLYSTLSLIKQGTLRRILKHILDNLDAIEDPLGTIAIEFLPLLTCVNALHFPDTEDHIIRARERLALEELLALMQKSHRIKDEWAAGKRAVEVKVSSELVPATIPFELTSAQVRAVDEIVKDIQSSVPMNRLLVGDVGSGKTVVAGIAGRQIILNGRSTALVAPTRILAEQHAETLAKLFPDLEIELVTAGTKTKKIVEISATPKLYIGTHALINRLPAIKPGLVIYDEQHRFGVAQRSAAEEYFNSLKNFFPHILTMSATPIPRSLMLTIFSHLNLSVIDELPKGRLPIKTWVVPETKRADSYRWILEQLQITNGQVLVICPFIDPSNSLALENVAAVKDIFASIETAFPKVKVAMLHGRMKKTEQSQITEQLYKQEIKVLVTTPIVEVGVDLPAAAIIMIEAAERFGLASLHQLRGRVGRAGQQAYCLLFSSSKSTDARERLAKFSQITKGSELAELDLQHRGAGDIFGTQQHGFDNLRFASWANFELISQARQLYDQLEVNSSWQPFLAIKQASDIVPLAN